MRAEWQTAYDAAERLLLDGRFAEAEGAATALLSTAKGRIERALADQLAKIAGDLERRGTRLAPLDTTSAAGAQAPLDERRSTGEIAELYLNGVLYGLGTAAFIEMYTEPRTTGQATLPALGLAGAGAALVAVLDRGKGLKSGVPQAIGSGLYLGLGEGITFTLWNQAHSTYYGEWEDTTAATVIWGAATAGAIAGGVLGSVYGSTPGRASYVTSAAIWSGAVIGLTGVALSSDDVRLDDKGLLAGAVGLNAGLAAGLLSAGGVSPSVARVRFLDLGALAGGLVVAGMYTSAVDKSTTPEGFAASGAAGIASGLAAAWILTAKMPKERPRSEDSASTTPVPLGIAINPTRGGATLSAYGLL